ncbi:phage fiber-tail adaptor protein [Sinorhizobium chiapasense]|uniref:Uncharacterized protein n=1 Tax=Sinorhizobium chiapasense TaxID=501572 RepID=A0ABZ2BB11_9HYPH
MTDVMQKAPADVLDFDIDFTRWLKDSDRIINATSTIEGGTAVVDRTDFGDSLARVWLSGGADGETSLVTTIATTEQGRTKEFCFNLKIRECH